jgi:hypothetical protein
MVCAEVEKNRDTIVSWQVNRQHASDLLEETAGQSKKFFPLLLSTPRFARPPRDTVPTASRFLADAPDDASATRARAVFFIWRKGGRVGALRVQSVCVCSRGRSNLPLRLVPGAPLPT